MSKLTIVIADTPYVVQKGGTLLRRNDVIDFNAPRVKPAEQEIKIRCRYCDLKDTCKRRATKEQYENAGWVTRCLITPNRPGKKRKAKRKK